MGASLKCGADFGESPPISPRKRASVLEADSGLYGSPRLNFRFAVIQEQRPWHRAKLELYGLIFRRPALSVARCERFFLATESIGPPTDRQQLSTERIGGQQVLPTEGVVKTPDGNRGHAQQHESARARIPR